MDLDAAPGSTDSAAASAKKAATKEAAQASVPFKYVPEASADVDAYLVLLVIVYLVDQDRIEEVSSELEEDCGAGMTRPCGSL